MRIQNKRRFGIQIAFVGAAMTAIASAAPASGGTDVPSLTGSSPASAASSSTQSPPARMTRLAGVQDRVVPPEQSPPATMTPVGLGGGIAPPPILPRSIYNQQFQQQLENQLPLSPGMIAQAKRLKSEVNRAIATPGFGVPKPVLQSIRVSLSPGAKPPEISLAQGNVTTLVFEDSTGARWPVEAVSTAGKAIKATIVGNVLAQGNSGGHKSSAPVTAQGGKGDSSQRTVGGPALGSGSNIVEIIPTTSQIVGRNLVVTLQNLPVPIIFTFEAGNGVVDYRQDITVPGFGPNAIVPRTQRSMPPLVESGIQSFLNGTPPGKAVHLEVSDPEVSAWYFGGKMFVRTDLTLASPYTMRRRSITGKKVYVLQPSPFFDVLRDGALLQVSVKKLPPAYLYADASGDSE